MKQRKGVRISVVIIAIVLGVVIVWGLTLIGKKGKGPVEQALSEVSEVFDNVEKTAILEKRTVKRADKLNWLQPYISNIENVKNPKTILLGAYDNNATSNFQPIIDLEDTLHTTLPFIQIYTAWGNDKQYMFPTTKVKSIVQLGSIPVITWEPWLTAFTEEENPQLKPMAARDKEGMQDVANGVYDFYLTQWANQAKKIKSPIVVRWAHEMNDPYRYPWGPQNNNAKDFIEAWKHVHDLFEKQGTKNIVWAWSPHPAYGFFKDYYPGDKYVDFVAIGTLNYGTVANWSKWWTFDDIFGKYYPELSAFNKPIMLSEFGSLQVGGNRSKWFADALRDIPKKYPMVKSILFFHFDSDNTTTQQTLNWSFREDKPTVKAIITQVENWNSIVK